MEQLEEKLYKNRFLILINVVMMTFVATLDGSIVNVALPTMAKMLIVEEQHISWVVTSYLLVITSTILIFGRLGDMKGKTRIFKLGIIIFTLGSFLCGLSNSLETLVISRVLQGVGAAAFMATNQGIITQVFPQNERGRALGIAGMTVALGTMSGPPLGGFLISMFSWKTIFFINIPIGIITYILGMKILPISNKSTFEKLDVKGSVLFMLSILAIFLSVQLGEMLKTSFPVSLFGIAIAALIMILFIHVERKTEAPMLQLSIFENKLFSISICCAFISFFVIGSSNIIQPFYLQNVMKLPTTHIGWVMIIYPLVLSIVAPLSGYLSDKIGSEFLTCAGLGFSSCGLFLMSTLNEHSSLVYLIIFISIMSIGNGLFQSPNTSLVMSTVPPNKFGVAGSINALVRNLGMVFGISLSTLLLFNQMSYKLGYPVENFVEGREDAFMYGMKSVYIVLGIISASGALLTAYRFYGKKEVLKTQDQLK